MGGKHGKYVNCLPFIIFGPGFGNLGLEPGPNCRVQFLFVDDLSSAIEFLIDKKLDKNIINVGSNEEITIIDLAKTIKELIGFKGELSFDSSKPDGNPRKLLDSSYINSIGWKAETKLKTGLEKTYKWFIENSI